jgi:hypothetical protein
MASGRGDCLTDLCFGSSSWGSSSGSTSDYPTYRDWLTKERGYSCVCKGGGMVASEYLSNKSLKMLR